MSGIKQQNDEMLEQINNEISYRVARVERAAMEIVKEVVKAVGIERTTVLQRPFYPAETAEEMIKTIIGELLADGTI